MYAAIPRIPPRAPRPGPDRQMACLTDPAPRTLRPSQSSVPPDQAIGQAVDQTVDRAVDSRLSRGITCAFLWISQR
jgi:hypothetical protein